MALGLVLFGQNNKIQFELLVGNVTLWDTVFEAVQRPQGWKELLVLAERPRRAWVQVEADRGHVVQGLRDCSSNDFCFVL